MPATRQYEVMFIVDPAADDDEVTRITENFKQIITDQGGSVTRAEPLGRRQLAYEIHHKKEGTFVDLELDGSGREITELERRMRVSEPVIKFITVRVDEEQKRLDKVKKIRASRVKRAPAPPPITPATVSTPEPAGTEPTAV